MTKYTALVKRVEELEAAVEVLEINGPEEGPDTPNLQCVAQACQPKVEEPVRRAELISISAYVDQRLTVLEHSIERLETQNRTVLQQYGGFRVAVKNIMLGLKYFNDGILNAGARAQGGLQAAVNDLDLTKSQGYTQQEVAKMGSEEYRDKILKPLGMGEYRTWK